MKCIRYLLISLVISSCGSEELTGPKGDQGPQGDPGTTVEVQPEFVGEYYMPYSGFVIITVNHENNYFTDVNLQSVNPDGSICILDLDGTMLNVHDSKIVYTGVIAMAAGNCKSDSNVALLTSATVIYQFEVTLKFNALGLLESDLLVFQTSSGVRTTVINRSLTEE